ncbi:MAG TPA: hypothetical protein VF906_02210 [Candidatus Bathyarchaeia archaeon]|nr:hypothetical protein [Candidatus Dormibacteraeota bacterium]
MPKTPRSTAARNSRKKVSKRDSRTNRQRVSSEDAIKAGEQIAMAAFASSLKLAAAFGTAAAKTAGLALASLASGADKFSKLVKEEAMRSNDGGSRISAESDSNPRRARRRNLKKTLGPRARLDSTPSESD